MQTNRTPRFSVSETPLVDEYLELIWQRHPRLRGSKAETVLFALGAYAVQCPTGKAELPQAELIGDSSDTPINPLDNLADLDLG
ncbi:MAG: hypothetical protein KME10_11370 [Plectolyngbya sp. WJT66-NPBG17]|jgi:hypothetical protein|nr:hypothetical protein [Plectolyngbya sp. WJT66-NPBG17]